MRITHLSLSEHDRQAAAVLAAMANLSLSEFIARLVRAEAARAKLVEFLAGHHEPSIGADDEERTP